MTIYLPEVRKISTDYINLPVFNPNVFSEDEDDLPGEIELEYLLPLQSTQTVVPLEIKSLGYTILLT